MVQYFSHIVQFKSNTENMYFALTYILNKQAIIFNVFYFYHNSSYSSILFSFLYILMLCKITKNYYIMVLNDFSVILFNASVYKII